MREILYKYVRTYIIYNRAEGVGVMCLFYMILIDCLSSFFRYLHMILVIATFVVTL